MAKRKDPSSSPFEPDRLINEVVKQMLVAGNEKMAGKVVPAAMVAGEAAYELGMGELLGQPTKALLRDGLHKAPELAAQLGMPQARALVGGAGQQVATEAAEQAITQGARELAKCGAREAAKAGARAVAGAGAVGAVVDGVASAAVNGRRYYKGEIDGAECAKRVAKDSAVGGACAAVGSAAVIGVVALTGPVSLPIAIGVAAVSSMGARSGIGWLMG